MQKDERTRSVLSTDSPRHEKVVSCHWGHCPDERGRRVSSEAEYETGGGGF